MQADWVKQLTQNDDPQHEEQPWLPVAISRTETSQCQVVVVEHAIQDGGGAGG
jgi:hypothetical protein